MRQIKFRAWDQWAKEMIYDFGATRNNYTLILGVDERDNLELRWEGENQKPLPLMQFTGLTDKRGNEVYHKDILKGSGKLWVIEWQEAEARFWIAPAGSNTQQWRFMDEVDRMEVCGNAYATPHLLNSTPNPEVSDTTDAK